MADPSLPGAGRFEGRAGVTEWAELSFAAFRAEQVTEPMQIIDSLGDVTFMRWRDVEVASCETGAKALISAAHEFRIDGGRIREHYTYADSHALAQILDGVSHGPTTGGNSR